MQISNYNCILIVVSILVIYLLLRGKEGYKKK